MIHIYLQSLSKYKHIGVHYHEFRTDTFHLIDTNSELYEENTASKLFTNCLLLPLTIETSIQLL